MASTTTFVIPETAVDYWMGRFADEGRDCASPKSPLGEQVLAFTDPDGLRLELVAEAGLNDALPG